MVDLLAEHARLEWMEVDIDRLMATLVPDPHIRFYGWGSRIEVNGYDAVRQNYENNYTFGKNCAGMEFDRIVVDDEAVVTEGSMVLLGRFAAATIPELQGVIEPSRSSLVRKQVLVIYPFRDGKIAGETFYYDGGYTVDDVQYLD
jgi:hypothetical protein